MDGRNTTNTPVRAPTPQVATPASSPSRSLDAVEAKYQLIPSSQQPGQAQAIPSPAPPLVAPRRLHRPRRPALVILPVLLLLLAAAVWWAIRSGWVPPWVQPAGPLTASGTLEADEILVGTEVAGRIVELVREGQAINAGDVVARLDDSLIQIQIQQGDLATRQRLQIQAERYLLRSPIAGVVTRMPMHTGEIVSPGQTVVAVADLTVLKLTAYVLERDLGSVQVGQVVTVTADPFDTRAFRGVVTSTNPRAEFTPRNVQTRADRLNLVFGVRVLVDNPDGALKPGMPADATFSSLP